MEYGINKFLIMNVLLIKETNPFFENSASANRYAGLIKGLLTNNINVVLLITGGYNNIDEFKKNGYRFHNNNLTIQYTVTVFNYNIWLKRLNHYILDKIIKKIGLRTYKKYCGRNFDYIWLTYNENILYSFIKYEKFIKCKTIIELNEFNDVYKSNRSINNKLQLKKALRSEKIFYKAIGKIDCFVIMTNTLISYYKHLAKPDASFLHLPMTVDLERFKNIIKSNKYIMPYIAYTGTYNNAKDGVDILIKAFSIIAPKYPEYRLYMAGFYHPDVVKQKELISILGLSNRIIYLGTLDKECIPEFICNADLLVLARPDSYQAQGGFPTKLGEYLATGNPVCVTRVGEIPNYLSDNISAFIAEPGDVESFANAMDRCLSDKDNARHIGAAGRKIADNNFSIDVQGVRLVQFLKMNL